MRLFSLRALSILLQNRKDPTKYPVTRFVCLRLHREIICNTIKNGCILQAKAFSVICRMPAK